MYTAGYQLMADGLIEVPHLPHPHPQLVLNRHSAPPRFSVSLSKGSALAVLLKPSSEVAHVSSIVSCVFMGVASVVNMDPDVWV